MENITFGLLCVTGVSLCLNYILFKKNKLDEENSFKQYKRISKENQKLNSKLADTQKIKFNLRKTETEKKILINELKNMECAYDELKKDWDQQFYHLKLWNILPNAPREVRRRFIATGEYTVYNNDGEIVFEV